MFVLEKLIAFWDKSLHSFKCKICNLKSEKIYYELMRKED